MFCATGERLVGLKGHLKYFTSSMITRELIPKQIKLIVSFLYPDRCNS